MLKLEIKCDCGNKGKSETTVSPFDKTHETLHIKGFGIRAYDDGTTSIQCYKCDKTVEC